MIVTHCYVTNSTIKEATSTSPTATSDCCEIETGCEFEYNQVIKQVFRTVHEENNETKIKLTLGKQAKRQIVIFGDSHDR